LFLGIKNREDDSLASAKWRRGSGRGGALFTNPSLRLAPRLAERE
jgi:hypothetical protein